MKKWIITICICLCITAVPHKSHAIVWVVVKAAAKKVIKALDLQVQRLQNKTISLQNAQKALENTMGKLKLGEISTWAEKQRKQYEDYYNELRKVRSVIAYYRRVREVMQMQVDIVDEYKNAYSIFQRDTHFQPRDLAAMRAVYDGILSESVKNIDLLLLVVNAFSTEMTDAQRLQVIAEASGKMEENLVDLKRFNASNALLSIKMAKDETEIKQLKVLYGLD